MEPLPASVEYLRRVIVFGVDASAQEIISSYQYRIPDHTTEIVNDYKERFTLVKIVGKEFREVDLPKKTIELPLAFYLHGFNPTGLLLAEGQFFVRQNHLTIPEKLLDRYTSEGFDLLYSDLRRSHK